MSNPFSTVWAYNSDTGAISSASSWSAWLELKAGLGWHGPFATKQDAINYYEQNKANNPGWKAPTGLAGTFKNAVSSTVGNPISDVIGKFNVGGWFLRIGEILLGLVLIGVGVAKLTGTSNVISTAAKVAMK